MANISVIPITPSMVLGEGPHWIEAEKSLIFVDHPGGNINKYYYETKRHQVLEFDNLKKDAGPVVGPSAVIPVQGDANKFIVGLCHDLSAVTWKQSDPDVSKAQPASIMQFDLHQPWNSLNDAKCDAHGRLWAGTANHPKEGCEIEPHLAALYRIDSNLKKEKVVDKVTLSNGMTWSLDNKLFYFIDSVETSVYIFDFDLEEAKISNQKLFLDLKKLGIEDEYPDGMTIDQNGNLWIALYNGGRVICVDSETAKIIHSIEVPSRYTTSCCFGGPDYSSLFVTSATRDMKETELKILPDSGKTFEIKGLGVRGNSHNCFKINADLINGT